MGVKGVPPDHTKFKKGQSGNPKGRPPVIPELNQLLAKVLSETKGDMTAAEAILRSLLQKATSSSHSQSVRAAEVLLERGFGKTTQPVDVTSKGQSITPPTINLIGSPDTQAD